VNCIVYVQSTGVWEEGRATSAHPLRGFSVALLQPVPLYVSLVHHSYPLPAVASRAPPTIKLEYSLDHRIPAANSAFSADLTLGGPVEAGFPHHVLDLPVLCISGSHWNAAVLRPTLDVLKCFLAPLLRFGKYEPFYNWIIIQKLLMEPIRRVLRFKKNQQKNTISWSISL